MLDASTVRKITLQSGFSLIELLVTIAILVILLTIAVPSLQEFMHRMRNSSNIADLQNAISIAHNEAITRRENTVLCKSPDGISCITTGTYAQGYIAFVDINRDGAVDPGEPVLQVNGPLARNYSLVGSADVVNNLRFTRTGYLIMTTAAAEPNLTLCSTSGNPRGKRLNITPNARTRIEDITTC